LERADQRLVNHEQGNSMTIDTGSHSPVVFLHGAAQDASAARWLDVPGLVAINLPGHGGRRRPRPGLRFVDMADEIAGWALEPLHLVGVGLGGNTALVFALEYPHLVRSLVLVSTLAHTDDRMVEERAKETERLGNLAMVEGAMQRWFSPGALARRPRPEPVAYAEAQMSRMPTAVMADIWRSALEYDVRDRLGTIRVPTTCVGGSYDRFMPSSEIEAMACSIPGARFVEVRAAHMAAHLEAPDEFSAVVRDHLTAIDDRQQTRK